MSVRWRWFVALTGLVLFLLVVWTRPPVGAAGSVLSQGPSGWYSVERALESVEVPVEHIDRRLDDLWDEEPERQGDGVLLVTFPVQGLSEDLPRNLKDHMRRGGTAVIGYTGELLSLVEDVVLIDLGITFEERFGLGPAGPLEWRRAKGADHPLRVPDNATAFELENEPIIGSLPRGPSQALLDDNRFTAWLEDEEGRPVVVSNERWGGRLIVMPTQLFSNARMVHSGNVEFLAWMSETLEGPWAFDEYRHGLLSPDAVVNAPERRVFDAVFVQLLLIYLLAVLALVWPFAPPWPKMPVSRARTATFWSGWEGFTRDWDTTREPLAGSSRGRSNSIPRRARRRIWTIVSTSSEPVASSISSPSSIAGIIRRTFPEIERIRVTSDERSTDSISKLGHSKNSATRRTLPRKEPCDPTTRSLVLGRSSTRRLSRRFTYVSPEREMSPARSSVRRCHD